eukprot:scaffold2628_cov113-Isochrysis_galbana.AAC.7
MRVVVKKALPLDIFNDPMFRKAVALTAAAGRSIVVGGEDTFMPKRKQMTSKILPVLDNSLNEKIQMKMRGVSAMGVVLVSPGTARGRPSLCTSVTVIGLYLKKKLVKP